MSRPFTFGIITIQNTTWQKTLESWQTIESLGFDSVWIADHFVNPRHPETPWLDGWSLLAALATRTTSIRIGTLVSPYPLRHPGVLARQAMTVDHISGGRLELGLGAGTDYDPTWRMLNIGGEGPAERVRRFREYVEQVDSLLRNESTTMQGQYHQLSGATMSPGPLQKPRPPLTIAAAGPAMLKIVARYADRWNTFIGTPQSMKEAAQTIHARNVMLDDACAQLGRDPGEITRSLLMLDRTTPKSPFSSIADFEDIVGHFNEAGITDFIFYYPPDEWYSIGGAAQEETLRRVAAEVIPKLR